MLLYPVAQYYGYHEATFSIASARRVLLSPIFLAVVAALIVNLADTEPGTFLTRTLSPLAVILRMFAGAVLGCFFVWLWGFSGATAMVVIASAAAPVGASAAAIASATKLDKEIAINAISISALAGLVSASSLLFLMSRILV